MQLPKISKDIHRIVKVSREQPKLLGRKANSLDLLLALIAVGDETSEKLIAIGITSELIRSFTTEPLMPAALDKTLIDKFGSFFAQFFEPSSYDENWRMVFALAIQHSYDKKRKYLTTRDIAWAIFQQSHNVIEEVLDSLNQSAESVQDKFCE